MEIAIGVFLAFIAGLLVPRKTTTYMIHSQQAPPPTSVPQPECKVCVERQEQENVEKVMFPTTRYGR
jgi:hypothetical protein